MDRCGLPVQEVFGVFDRLAIAVRADFPHTRRRTSFDLKLQTRARSAVKGRVRTVTQQKHTLQLIQCSIHSTCAGERAVIVPLLFLGTPVLFQLREIVFGRHQDIWETLVIAQQHVELRLELFDQVLLKQQRFGFGTCCEEHHRRGHRNHACNAARVPRWPCITANARAQIPRLTHIQNATFVIQHTVDTGRSINCL